MGNFDSPGLPPEFLERMSDSEEREIKGERAHGEREESTFYLFRPVAHYKGVAKN